ncbi:MAG TPA: AAA family ATPase, partial [Burkholderiales bacterium]|nr:AAA family ATPase [Burkholderiales bacterium]
TRIVEAHGGMVNQFVGDEVLALFGIPIAHEDDPVRAVRAALALHDMAREASREVEARIGQPIRLHSGINTGLIVARSRDLRDGTYGVTGDAVNTAARLVGQAAPDEVVLSPETQRLVADYFTAEPLETVVLKGKAEPVRPWKVTGKTAVASRWEAAQRRGLTRYAGRDVELAALRAAARRVRSGHGQFVTVVGEPGIGKSRLMFELRHGLEGEDIAIIEGRCQASGTDTPYLPFIDALRRGLGLRETEPIGSRSFHDRAVSAIRSLGADLEECLPLLLHLLSVPSSEHPLPRGLRAEALRRALDEALIAAFVLASRPRCVLLVLEDWHWADEASDRALLSLVSLLPSCALMVVVTHRPESARLWPAAGHHASIVLGPLGVRHTETMVRSVLGARDLPPGLAERIHERSGGNALFNEEVGRALAEEGAVVVEDGVAALARPMDSIHLPDTVQAVIRARVDRLDPEAREVLRFASVIGREFGRRVLERLVPSPHGLDRSLEAVVRQDLVQPVKVVPEPVWLFKHVLVQEVVYETMLYQQRRALHGRVGAILEELHASRLEEHYEALAHHYAQSDELHKALKYLEGAGDKAARYFSLREARSYYNQGVRLLEQPAIDAAGQRRFIGLAAKWAEVSFYSASQANMAALERALVFARDLGDEQLETQTLFWIVRMHYCLGQMTRAEEAFQEFERRFERDPGNLLLARARITQSIVYLYMDEYDRGISAIQAALPVLEAEEDIEHLIWGRGMLGGLTNLQGRLQESAALTTQAYAHATAVQNKVRQAMSRNYATLAEIYVGQLDEAAAHAEECIGLGTQVQASVPIAFGQSVRGYTLLLQGRGKEGIALMREAIRTVRAAGTTLATSIFLARLAEGLALSGDTVGVRNVAEEYAPVLQMGNRWGQIQLERALGIAGALDGSADWQHHFEDSIRFATERKARPELAISHLRYAEALAQTGDTSRVGMQLEAAEALFREIGMTWWLEQASVLRHKLG